MLVCRVFFNLRPLKCRCSLVIHTFSKEIEKEDGKKYQSVLFAIVNKVFELSGIRSVIINNRILEVFKKKIFCFERAVKKAEGNEMHLLQSRKWSPLIEACAVANVVNFQFFFGFINLRHFNIIQFCIFFPWISLFNGGVCCIFVAKPLWFFCFPLWLVRHFENSHLPACALPAVSSRVGLEPRKTNVHRVGRIV